MSQSEVSEVPNWLSELERKREIRLKARLGHEAGAGASCIKCEEKCPGLDLHFWRKICKNCKCSKEDHDVHDDDIYGWAQFQLLGSKPNKVKKKIVLPGKKDEVELDWAPKGNTETIDKYLKTLAPETLPVKGSQAAQERKQLLQKQIPIHDLDPGLCHDLTELELAKMQDYIKHMKSSAGVGQVIQFGVNYGTKHFLGDPTGKIISDRYPKEVPSIETVQLLGERKTGTLSAQLDRLAIKDQKELDAFFDKIPKPHNMTAQNEKLNTPPVLGQSGYLPKFDTNQHPQIYGQTELNELGTNPPSFSRPLELNPKKRPVSQQQFADFSKYPQNYLRNTEINKNFTNPASQFARENILNDTPVNYMRESPIDPKINYKDQETSRVPDYSNEVNRNGKLSNYAPTSINVYNEQQYPTQNLNNIRDLTYATNDLANLNYKPLQNYIPNQMSISENQLVANPVNIGAIRDINYDDLEVKKAVQGENHMFAGLHPTSNIPEDIQIETKQCRKCSKHFAPDEFAIFVEKSNALYHSDCFKCAGCNQNLADLFYFYDKESDNIYCGRDFAKIWGIPRCQACDELIFVKEYCLAENSTFHLKHFCCFECDQALAGQNYVLEDSQPVCLPCFEKLKANKCISCLRVIAPDEQGVSLAEGIHFHAADECFCCWVCKKVLHGAKLLFRNNRLYCSHDCFRGDK